MGLPLSEIKSKSGLEWNEKDKRHQVRSSNESRENLDQGCKFHEIWRSNRPNWAKRLPLQENSAQIVKYPMRGWGGGVCECTGKALLSVGVSRCSILICMSLNLHHLMIGQKAGPS